MWLFELFLWITTRVQCNNDMIYLTLKVHFMVCLSCLRLVIQPHKIVQIFNLWRKQNFLGISYIFSLKIPKKKIWFKHNICTFCANSSHEMQWMRDKQLNFHLFLLWIWSLTEAHACHDNCFFFSSYIDQETFDKNLTLFCKYKCLCLWIQLKSRFVIVVS